MGTVIDNPVVMARLSLQRALLGEVSKKLRAVVFSVSGEALDIRFYFDGEVEERDIESASCVETEVLADYEESFKVCARTFRLDAPEPIDDDGIWVFRRNEK
ncbi:hypothetical protein [Pseudomonas sp. GZD-209]|uniref:hypothetical protein n=1 Tax=Pseudomonas sp. GZD-209 TaxID=3404807 RepID=UPI003BB4CBE7